VSTDVAAKIQPLGDRIVVQAKSQEEVTRGGIVLPDTAKEKPLQGVVVAVGPGAVSEKGERLPMDVKPGQTVLYGKYSGTEIKLETQEYLILKLSDVLAILE